MLVLEEPSLEPLLVLCWLVLLLSLARKPGLGRVMAADTVPVAPSSCCLLDQTPQASLLGVALLLLEVALSERPAPTVPRLLELLAPLLSEGEKLCLRDLLRLAGSPPLSSAGANS